MSETEARSGAPQRPEPSPAADSATGAGSGTGSADPTIATATPSSQAATAGTSSSEAASTDAARKRRRRGSRGGRKRSKPRADGAEGTGGDDNDDAGDGGRGGDADDRPDEMPDHPREGRPSVEAADKALVRKPAAAASAAAGAAGTPAKPKIGDTMPAPAVTSSDDGGNDGGKAGNGGNGGGKDAEGRSGSRRGRGGRGGGQAAAKATNGGGTTGELTATSSAANANGDDDGQGGKRKRRRRGRGKGAGDGREGRDSGQRQGSGSTRPASKPVEMLSSGPVELDEETLERRRGRERKGRPVGRYMMCVQVSDKATQIAVLEGRALIEHYVSRPSDDISQIHGNVYLGKVQNVLPGMEAAFVDIGTPKNAVLYRGDVHYDREDVERTGGNDRNMRIEQMLRAGQTILCQVTKNPIGAKGARLTQEVSLPGRFVVLIPNSSTYGISKRLPDDERKRLRQVLDRVKPAQHGIIVRTAAEGVTSDEIENDVRRLLRQWEQIDQLAKRSKAPAMLYREPDMAVRVIREEFNQHYRGVVIDDKELYEQVRDYVGSISPTLADRVEFYDPAVEDLPLFEKHHVHEQLHRALDPKVWLPSGGSLIIERTEALTVIDVNTGKNVGKSSLEDTVFKNNMEAAVEIARQLRLRDIGGIIVVDFIDMERRDNRDQVVQVFRDSLSRDKTRTQVFEISELGLYEMTRKRIGEGLLESFSTHCPMCEGRGVVVDKELLPD